MSTDKECVVCMYIAVCRAWLFQAKRGSLLMEEGKPHFNMTNTALLPRNSNAVTWCVSTTTAEPLLTIIDKYFGKVCHGSFKLMFRKLVIHLLVYYRTPRSHRQRRCQWQTLYPALLALTPSGSCKVSSLLGKFCPESGTLPLMISSALVWCHT